MSRFYEIDALGRFHIFDDKDIKNIIYKVFFLMKRFFVMVRWIMVGLLFQLQDSKECFLDSRYTKM